MIEKMPSLLNSECIKSHQNSASLIKKLACNIIIKKNQIYNINMIRDCKEFREREKVVWEANEKFHKTTILN